jgi:hypothetical protein
LITSTDYSQLSFTHGVAVCDQGFVRCIAKSSMTSTRLLGDQPSTSWAMRSVQRSIWACYFLLGAGFLSPWNGVAQSGRDAVACIHTCPRQRLTVLCLHAQLMLLTWRHITKASSMISWHALMTPDARAAYLTAIDYFSALFPVCAWEGKHCAFSGPF